METRDVTLLTNIKSHLGELEALLEKCDGDSEDLVYRFYHQSFKVFWIQAFTEEIVTALRNLLPDRELNAWFLEIVQAGTGREFAMEDNEQWLLVTRPMLEAFFHARYFLEMACTYGKELESAPQILPSGWAGVLCLYRIR